MFNTSNVQIFHFKNFTGATKLGPGAWFYRHSFGPKIFREIIINCSFKKLLLIVVCWKYLVHEELFFMVGTYLVRWKFMCQGGASHKAKFVHEASHIPTSSFLFYLQQMFSFLSIYSKMHVRASRVLKKYSKNIILE